MLDALLEKCRDEGMLDLDDANILKEAPFSAMGSVVQLVRAFGDKDRLESAAREMRDELYRELA